MKNRPSYKEQSWGLEAVFQWHYDSSKKICGYEFCICVSSHVKKQNQTKEIDPILGN